MFKTFCSICTKFWNMRISICLQKLLKIFKFSNILQIDLEVIRMRAIQDLKAQNTYFSYRKNLGTIGVPFVPKKYKFRFYYKIYQNLTDSTHKWNLTEKCGTQVVPKFLYSKSTRSKLFNAVSTVSIVILDQKLQPTSKKGRLEDQL